MSAYGILGLLFLDFAELSSHTSKKETVTSVIKLLLHDNDDRCAKLETKDSQKRVVFVL